jgi:hypothetical protein
MLTLPPTVRIFVAAVATDLRRSMDGLAVIVREQLALDPLAGHLYLFRNRRGDRLKVLWFDRSVCLANTVRVAVRDMRFQLQAWFAAELYQTLLLLPSRCGTCCAVACPRPLPRAELRTYHVTVRLSLLASNYASLRLTTNEGNRNEEVCELLDFRRRSDSLRIGNAGTTSRREHRGVGDA